MGTEINRRSLTRITDDVTVYFSCFLGGVILLVAIGLISVHISRANEEVDPLAIKLQEPHGEMTLEDIELSIPFTQRVLLPIIRQIARITEGFAPQQMMEKAQHLLDMAGNPRGLTPTVVIVLRLVGLIFLSVFLALLMSRQAGIYVLGSIIVGAVLGYMSPVWLLKAIATNRQELE